MPQGHFDARRDWAEIAHKSGRFVEQLVVPMLPNVIQQILAMDESPAEILAGGRFHVWHPQDYSRVREFDYIYVTRQGWIIVESTSDRRMKDVDRFRELLAEANEFFPQYANLRLYPLFAALNVPDHVVTYCTLHKIYAMGLGAETMQLLNMEELSVKRAAPSE